MFLQGQTSHEPLLTIVALTGSIPVAPRHVVLHGYPGHESEAAVPADHLTVLLLEGRLEVGVQEVSVAVVVGLDVVLQRILSGEVYVAQMALVSDPRVFLSQVPLKVLN